jgi:hypothetical protein
VDITIARVVIGVGGVMVLVVLFVGLECRLEQGLVSVIERLRRLIVKDRLMRFISVIVGLVVVMMGGVLGGIVLTVIKTDRRYVVVFHRLLKEVSVIVLCL